MKVLKTIESKQSFGVNKLRYGSLYYDYTDIDNWETSPSGGKIYCPIIRYIYDTLLHTNGAKLQDAEDWDDSLANYSHISSMLYDLYVDLSQLNVLSGLVEFDRVKVIVDIYGLGNRKFTLVWELYGAMDRASFNSWEDTKGEARTVYYFDMDDILQHKTNFMTYGDNEVKLNMNNIRPDSNFIRRKFCKTIVDYLSQGYSNLE